MKKLIKGLMVMLVMSFASDISGQAYQSAVGGRLGTFFTGSYKMFINETSAIEGIVGFDRQSYGFGLSSSAFILGGFYQIHKDLDLDGNAFQWYYGFGGHIAIISGISGIPDSGGIGVIPSGIIGIEYNLEDTPVNFFLDAQPGIYLGEGGTDFEINGSIGARYILNR